MFLDKKLFNKIILIRHGQSEGNVNTNIYNEVPDEKVQLTKEGILQAKRLGKSFLDSESICEDDLYICSTYDRARDTLDYILNACFGGGIFEDIHYDPRLREQEFRGHLNSGLFDESQIQSMRKFGSFYYRFEDCGESGADVYQRVQPLLYEAFHHEQHRLFTDHLVPTPKRRNLIIVSHGITINNIIMALGGFDVRDYDLVKYPKNCKPIVFENGELVTEIEFRRKNSLA